MQISPGVAVAAGCAHWKLSLQFAHRFLLASLGTSLAPAWLQRRGMLSQQPPWDTACQG